MFPDTPTPTKQPLLQLTDEEVVVVPEELELLDESSFFAQEMRVRLKRKRERIMSRCFTWFLISGLGKPKLYQNMWCFTRNWEGCKENVKYWDEGGNEFDKNLNLISKN